MKSNQDDVRRIRARKTRSRWAAALVAAGTAGAILGGTLPASATVYYPAGGVEAGTYRHYYGTWRYHSNGYASFTLNSYDVPGLCGGSMRYALWDGTGSETPLLYFNSTGVNQPFTWPAGGYVLPTNNYAMIDGNSGSDCAYINWSGTLNL